MNPQYRFFNYSVFLLAFLGLGVGYIILPSKDELAYLNFKDKNFKAALVRYEKQYESGDRSATLIGPLCDLYLKYGEIDRAISILEENLQTLPNELEARNRLSTYYQYAQRPTDYMLNLEAIAKLKPTRNILSKLAQIYNYNEQYNKEISILKTIIAKYGASHQDDFGLAVLYASQKRYPEAVGMVEQLFDQYFAETTATEIIFALSLMLDLHRQEAALSLARRVIKQKGRYLVRISDFFIRRGALPIAHKLLEPYEQRTDLPAEILSALISVQLAQGEEKKAMARLTRRFGEHKLPTRMVSPFLELILARQDPKLLHQFIYQAQVTFLREREILQIARLLIQLKQTEDALVLRRRLKRRYLVSHRLAAAVLEIVGHGVHAEKDEALLAKNNHLEDWRKLYLARIYHELELYDLAKAQLKQVHSLTDIRILERAEAVELFVYYQMAPKAAQMMQRERERVQNRPLLFQLSVMYSWMLLQLAMNHTQVVDDWVASLDNPPVDLFAQEYFMAVRFQRYGVALEAAEKDRKLDPGPKADAIYAQALVYNNLYAKALGLLSALYQKEPNAWLDPYAKALFASGEKEAWLQLWKKELETPQVTKARESEIAFIFLDHGYKEAAETIFLKQAATASPHSKEVEQLLFLWGPRPTKKQLEWLITRTERSDMKSKANWFQKLIQVGQGQRFLDYIQQHQPIETTALEDLYLSYLQGKGNTREFIAALSSAIEHEEDEKRLKRLALMASGQPLAERAFKKLLSKIPQDKDTMVQLGVVAYQQGHFRDATAYFEEALNLGQVDPILEFYYGELLTRSKDPRAKQYFEKALQELAAAKPTDQGTQLIRARIFWQLKQRKKTVNIYRQLIAAHPLELSLKSNLANYLIELGKIDEAAELINVR